MKQDVFFQEDDNFYYILLQKSQDYLSIKPFVKEYDKKNYAEFTYHVLSDLSLFITEPDLDFNVLKLMIDKIMKTLPAMRRIFSKPLLHLKEESVVMPVEAVRKIDNETIQHAGTHTSLWQNMKKGHLSPSKLLTRVYQDNYSIYENLVFCDTVDDCLDFIKYYSRLLKDLIVTKRIIELNLLERVHHLQYFQSLGKLYTGYIKFFNQFYDLSYRLLQEMNYISNDIISQLKFPVYKKNFKRPKNLILRKTNILSMHKDYRKIYSLSRSLNKKNKQVKQMQGFTVKKIRELELHYSYFFKILILFSLNHFNFSFNGMQEVDLDNLNIKATFKQWTITLTSHKIEDDYVVLLNASKDRNYQIALIPVIYSTENRELQLNQVIQKVSTILQADEYIVATPLEFDEYANNECFVSISNLESFRRLQQIFLRAMVHSDNKRADCPFCEQKIFTMSKKRNEHKIYVCKHCRMIIADVTCPRENKQYTYTHILNLANSELKYEMEEDIRIQNRKLEAQMFFRNITKLDSKLGVICPHCREIHKFE